MGSLDPRHHHHHLSATDFSIGSPRGVGRVIIFISWEHSTDSAKSLCAWLCVVVICSPWLKHVLNLEFGSRQVGKQYSTSKLACIHVGSNECQCVDNFAWHLIADLVMALPSMGLGQSVWYQHAYVLLHRRWHGLLRSLWFLGVVVATEMVFVLLHSHL